MPNGTYGGVRGKETKIGQKIFVSRPTRFIAIGILPEFEAQRKINKEAIDNKRRFVAFLRNLLLFYLFINTTFPVLYSGVAIKASISLSLIVLKFLYLAG